MNNKLNLKIGTEFGKWLIISDNTKRINNLTHWECRCVCGTEEFVPLNNLMNGSSTQCKNCGRKDSGLKKRKGIGDLSGDHWARIKSRIKKKYPSFSTRIEVAWNKFIQQDKTCFLSNRYIQLSGYPYDPEKTTAEYVILDGNFEAWVHKDVAKALSVLTSYELTKLSFDIKKAWGE